MAVKHEIRSKDGKTQKVSLTPLRAIRAQCLECVCWQPEEVKLCTSPLCSLFPFRFGTDSSAAKNVTLSRAEAISRLPVKKPKI